MQAPLTIRKAQINDIPVIVAMYAKRVRFNDTHGTHQWDLDEVTWEAFSTLYTIDDYYVGIYQDQIVGGLFIVDIDTLYWPKIQKEESLYLHKICIDPSFSGLGFADALIQYFIQKGRVKGYPYVCLDVRAPKDKLRAMYERNGFVLHTITSIFPSYQTALYKFTYK